MKRIIINALAYLASNNKVFCSEADFQFALAWEIQRLCPNARILLENGVQVNGQTYYVDIIVFLSGSSYYVELKYQTSICSFVSQGVLVNLKEHAAEDIMRYDYLKDIHRLYDIKKDHPSDYGGGYAIILSNDKHLYQEPSIIRTNTLDSFFRIHERPNGKPNVYPIPGLVAWNTAKITSSTHWTKTGSRNMPFSIPQINTHWEDYLSFLDNSGKRQMFKYLLNETI